jgi:hypothetical protein
MSFAYIRLWQGTSNAGLTSVTAATVSHVVIAVIILDVDGVGGR